MTRMYLGNCSNHKMPQQTRPPNRPQRQWWKSSPKTTPAPQTKRLNPIHPWWGGILGRRSFDWLTYYDIFPWVFFARFRAYHIQYYKFKHTVLFSKHHQQNTVHHGNSMEIHLCCFSGCKVCFHYMVPPQNVTLKKRVTPRCTWNMDPASYVVCEKASGLL